MCRRVPLWEYEYELCMVPSPQHPIKPPRLRAGAECGKLSDSPASPNFEGEAGFTPPVPPTAVKSHLSHLSGWRTESCEVEIYVLPCPHRRTYYTQVHGMHASVHPPKNHQTNHLPLLTNC
eukprot:scaffold19280_cov116-Isochrysis_galbana.AAC.7